MAGLMKIQVFWDVTLCELGNSYCCCRGLSCLHLHV